LFAYFSYKQGTHLAHPINTRFGNLQFEQHPVVLVAL